MEDNTWEGSAALLRSMTLRVYRMEAMVAFYQEAFGVSMEEKRLETGQAWYGWLGEVMLCFIPLASETEPDEYPALQLGLEVEDVDAALELCLKYGGIIIQEPIQRLDEVYAVLRDPDGNALELYGPVREEEEED
jgi:predicted enzyme related to lactoylglutathione lyase